MTARHRLPVLRPIACALLLACTHGLARADAASELYLFDWWGRNSDGAFTYNHAAVDEDPDPLVGVYNGIIYRYAFWGRTQPGQYWREAEAYGGSIRVQAPTALDPADPDGGCGAQACQDGSITFYFGAATVDSPAHYWMTAALPARDLGWGQGDHLPGPWDAHAFGPAWLRNDRNGESIIGLDWGVRTSNQTFAGPVPEPETWAMGALGLGLLAAARRRTPVR